MKEMSRGHNSATTWRPKSPASQASETHLYFECLSLQSLEEGLVCLRHESHGLVARAVIGLEHVAEADILEALALPDVVVILCRSFVRRRKRVSRKRVSRVQRNNRGLALGTLRFQGDTKIS